MIFTSTQQHFQCFSLQYFLAKVRALQSGWMDNQIGQKTDWCDGLRG